MNAKHPPPRGRGAEANPSGRFEKLAYQPELEDLDPEEEERPRKTEFLKDTSKSIITYNQSPDVRFDAGINPYRGCEHGCSYCYARPYHEYLGMSPGLDFETKILVKENAPALLRKELLSKKWKPQLLGISGVTDAYQPIEKKLKLTRGCLEVLAEFRNPVAIVTKNRLVSRDADRLSELAKYKAAAVYLSITSLDPDLRRRMEPRTSSPQQRLEAIRALTEAGVPAGVLIGPVVPGLTDHEIPSILAEAAKAGAAFASYIILRLPLGVGPIFEAWLEANYPNKKEKVLSRIRDLHGGTLNDTRTVTRMKGEGAYSEQIASMFRMGLKKSGIAHNASELSSASFRRPIPEQITLFE
jgi:DNA repair photolyase